MQESPLTDKEIRIVAEDHTKMTQRVEEEKANQKAAEAERIQKVIQQAERNRKAAEADPVYGKR